VSTTSNCPRPRDLTPLPLADALQLRGRVMTMAIGQWDAVLSAAYEQGGVLLELADYDRPVRAYRKAEARRRA